MTTHICTVKYGNKYTSDNVNTLYDTIKKTCHNFKFYCLTDDSTGLYPNINIINIEEDLFIKRHWNKLRFFDPAFIHASPEDDIIIMDIDQLFIGDASKIINHPNESVTCCFRWWTNQKTACPISGGLIKFKADGSTKYLIDKFLLEPNKWLMYYHIESKLKRYPENILPYCGEQNFIYHNLIKSHSIKFFPKEYVVKYDGRNDFMESQKQLYSKRVGGELLVNGNLNPRTVLVHFSGVGNDVSYSSTSTLEPS
jgi:hypothetical protein